MKELMKISASAKMSDKLKRLLDVGFYLNVHSRECLCIGTCICHKKSAR